MAGQSAWRQVFTILNNQACIAVATSPAAAGISGRLVHQVPSSSLNELRQCLGNHVRQFAGASACSSSNGAGMVLSRASEAASSRMAGSVTGCSWASLRAAARQATASSSPAVRMVLARAKSTAAAAATSAGAAAVEAAPLLGSSAALTHGLTDKARRQLVWWLGGSAAWVYSMVVLGGVTRLTRSGLSMTDWKLTGERPPITQEDWEAEFERYKASPEFKKVHRHMKLDEFKFIFWMEYAHRMWGRFLGVAFVVPGAYFVAKGYINKALAKRLGLLFFMGGTQGLVGWWMVRSGLVEPEHEWQTPRVSPYRLAAHLVSAFTIYATMVWTALDLAAPKPLAASVGSEALSAMRGLRKYLLPFSALVAVTATSGAFVAGLDAGRAYNTWPLMGSQWIPDEYIDKASHVWASGPVLGSIRNLFENTAAVQFDHRMLALATAGSALALWQVAQGRPQLPAQVLTRMNLVALVTAAQFGLGIWTLLAYVPTHLGSAHQANALNLFTVALAALHAVRPVAPGPISTMLAKVGAPLAVLAVGSIGFAVTTQK